MNIYIKTLYILKGFAERAQSTADKKQSQQKENPKK
jgi:hypothetical protein